MTSQKVTTVTGDIPLDSLGITLTHEHICMTFDCCYVPKPSSVVSWPENSVTETRDSFELRNLGYLRQYPYSFPYNLKLNDKDTLDVMVDELRRFKELGGCTIVENTIHGISRDIGLLRKLSLETGVNIISGTGFYVENSQPESVRRYTIEEIHDIMLKELMEEAEDSIKCGFIGEIGCSYPIQPFERNVIQAVALLQQETGKSISFHPGRNKEAPFEIMRYFLEAGGSPKGVIMSHLDRTLFEPNDLLEFANLFKVYNQLDLFGTECSFYQFNTEVDMISDAERIKKVRILVDDGHLDRILLSHDIHTKHRLVNFGGHGYGHIIQNVLPVMKSRGFTKHEIQSIIQENPQRWLSAC